MSQESHILESALDQAFTVLPLPATTSSETTKSGQDPHASATELADSQSTTSHTSNDLEESWKAEYEAQVQSWRAQSAEAREKAEQERLRWESIRAAEKEEAAKRKATGIADEPPKSIVHQVEESSNITSADTTSSDSVPDSGHPTTSSTQGGPVATSPLSRQDTATEKWEDLPSVTSSFPSMSFPEHVDTPPYEHRVAPQPAPASLTSAIFDSSLSRRTRLTAFFSSLAVNLLLPFINGVMLGFGEIFAKNIVMDWLGWRLKPRSVATAVGIRVKSREQRQTFSR